jgi:hypothetical protein
MRNLITRIAVNETFGPKKLKPGFVKTSGENVDEIIEAEHIFFANLQTAYPNPLDRLNVLWGFSELCVPGTLKEQVYATNIVKEVKEFAKSESNKLEAVDLLLQMNQSMRGSHLEKQAAPVIFEIIDKMHKNDRLEALFLVSQGSRSGCSVNNDATEHYFKTASSLSRRERACVFDKDYKRASRGSVIKGRLKEVLGAPEPVVAMPERPRASRRARLIQALWKFRK